ncbi:MAG: hypothetical protein FJ146_08745 [Deltaproteobacteria bacterium]|nr:hypothetical protein [Deltaproteobacteria bacterium]
MRQLFARANYIFFTLFTFFFAETALAKVCRIDLTRNTDGKTESVSFYYRDCSIKDLATFSKRLSPSDKAIFGDLVRQSLTAAPITGPANCETGRCAKGPQVPESYQMVAVSYEQAPAISAVDERNEMDKFGVNKYEPRRDREYVVFYPPPSSSSAGNQDAFSSNAVGGLMAIGYLVANIDLIGVTLKQQGAMVSYAYDVLVRGRKETDERAAADRAMRRALILDTIEQSIEAVKISINQVTEANKSVELEIRRIQTEGSVTLGEATSSVAASLATLNGARDQADAVALRMTTRPQPIQDALTKTEDEIARLRQGMLPAEAIAKERRSLAQMRTSGEPAALGERISALAGLAQSTTSDARREQYQEALRSVTDDRGLVSSWALAAGVPGHLTLKTDEWSPVGRAVRQVLNETLGHIAKDSKDSQNGRAAELGHIVGTLALADQYLASGSKLLGDRYLNRARAKLDYATNHPRLATYRSITLSDAARQRFGISIGEGTYEDYQTARVSNRLAAIAPDQFSESMYLAASVAVRQLTDRVIRAQLLRFDQALDNAYAVLDFVTGAGTGAFKGAASMVDGIATMVTHPIDSATAIATAIKNYEQTYQIIYDQVAKIATDYPSYSAEQKGEVVGRVTFELATFYAGAGLTKAATAAAVMTAVPEISAVAATLTGEVIEAARGLKLLHAYAPAALTGQNIAQKLRSGTVAEDLVRGGMRPDDVGVLADKLVRSGDDAISVIGPERYAQIINTPKGQRPLPETYLPKSYIDAHLAKFDEGATRLIPKQRFDRYGPAQTDGTAFVLTKRDADRIIEKCGNDLRSYEQYLGYDRGALDGDTLLRLDIQYPQKIGLRLPSGNEPGANSHWLPGGILPSGSTEAVVDLSSAPQGTWDVSNILKQ